MIAELLLVQGDHRLAASRNHPSQECLTCRSWQEPESVLRRTEQLENVAIVSCGIVERMTRSRLASLRPNVTKKVVTVEPLAPRPTYVACRCPHARFDLDRPLHPTYVLDAQCVAIHIQLG